MLITALPKERAPISVVIPCYRCGDTIRRAVQSVAAQSVPPGEVILVDDHSADGTLDTLHKVASEYPSGWIRVVALPVNGGAGCARNAGWDVTTQPYVAFIDADDAWHAKKLEIQYDWMRGHPNVRITGHLSDWVKYGEIPATKPGETTVVRINPCRLLFGNCFSLRSVVVRRDMTIRFDPGKRYMEDYWWVLQLAFSGCDIYRIEFPLAYTFKAPYGAGGLSGRLWEMEKSELDAYRGLWRGGRISLPTTLLFSLYSLLKFARRLLVSAVRR